MTICEKNKIYFTINRACFSQSVFKHWFENIKNNFSLKFIILKTINDNEYFGFTAENNYQKDYGRSAAAAAEKF